MVMQGQIDRSLREALIHELTLLEFTEDGGTNEYGQPSGTWGETEKVRALIKHFAPSEDRNRQETMTQRYTVIVPPDVGVSFTMRMQWGITVLDIETTEDIYYPLSMGGNPVHHHTRIRAFEVTDMGDEF